MTGHTQIISNPKFTGVDMTERLKAAGEGNFLTALGINSYSERRAIFYGKMENKFNFNDKIRGNILP
ncbi:hypothetical protein [Paenibacillus uliginis]|uniref:hypothetical protein n=1 Tax=Paenibacillus uliginis TaxID=683737 RepID=UPI001AD7EDA8|nr:hypothetical protein [Paenibacillus uliginis]